MVALVTLVALVAYLGRGGYEDAGGGELSLLDAFYYASVSITTTGYGDITPVSEAARVLNTVLVTPARILFLILLVGTTVEILTERAREGYRRRRWRSELEDHIIVCGYGTKGRTAVTAILGKGIDRSRVVVIDTDTRALEQANSAGLAAVAGDAASTATLEQAEVARARSVIVASDRDDATTLITLTARELNPRATIVSAVREEENAHLLRQGGADSVISSSGAAGRLLGLATQTPSAVEVLEDLLSVGEGLDIVERPARDDEVGSRAEASGDELVVAISRDGELVRFDDPRAGELRADDSVICLCSREQG